MKIVLLKCSRTYELQSHPSIYHHAHLTELQFIFSPRHLFGGIKLCMSSHALIICFTVKEGHIGQTTASIK